MSTEIHKTWNDVKKEISDLLDELQTWRDYEEEVSYDTDFADMLTDAIDGLLPLMPTVIVGR
jgi:hypothetical protein